MARRGEQFERAIYDYYRSHYKDAEVLFDHRVPDRDTGALRQVDVWVTARILDNILLTILISCKDHARPLDVGEVETFMQEIRSTGAYVGVLYGKNGFTENAVNKAKKNNVQCCRLYDNSPPELPSEVFLTTFVAYPVYRLMSTANSKEVPEELRWNDVFATQQRLDRQLLAVPEMLSKACLGLLLHAWPAPADAESSRGPQDLIRVLQFKHKSAYPAFNVHLALTWKWFRGRLSAYSLSGSHNVTSGDFAGSARVGPIPATSLPDHRDWEPCEPQDCADSPVGVTITTSPLACPMAAHFIAIMGTDRVFGGKYWEFGPPPVQDLGSSLQSMQCQPAPGINSIKFSAEVRSKLPPHGT